MAAENKADRVIYNPNQENCENGRESVNPCGGTAHWDCPQPFSLSHGLFHGLLALTFQFHASEVSF